MFTITLRKLLILTYAFKSLVTLVTFVSYKRSRIISKETAFTVLSELQCSGFLL